MRPPVDVDAVTALVEHVAATVVAPRFRDLVAGEVGEKGPGDLVTVVDHAAEEALTAGLRALAPGIPVIGEEAASADPALLDLLTAAPLVWVVDPLDGTRAFVEGSPDYAVMVGLVADGEPVAGWIRLPEHDTTLVAERGSGVTHNGAPLAPAARPATPRMLVAGRYLPDDVRAGLSARLGLAGGPVGGATGTVLVDTLWAGREYSRVALGEADAMLAWRTLPWDHVPGVAIVRELGGVARRLDGADYRPDVPVLGLLVAADARTADEIGRTLALGELVGLTRGPA